MCVALDPMLDFGREFSELSPQIPRAEALR